MITEVTNFEIEEDIARFQIRIQKAQAKLVELSETYKDKLKAKQLRDELTHVRKLVDIAKSALVGSYWNDEG